MPGLLTNHYSDAPALSLSLGALAREGIRPRSLLFLAEEPSGVTHLVLSETRDDVSALKVGQKLTLRSPLEGRLFHFDSVHRLPTGHILFNGDRRLLHTGNASEVAGAVCDYLKDCDVRSVFFGCVPHHPGTWVATRDGMLAVHDAGFCEVVVVGDALLARRMMDHRLWEITIRDGHVEGEALFDSPLGEVLMLERRAREGRLVLSCADGLVEVDVSHLPRVVEHDRARVPSGVAVVGRIGSGVFAVTRGQRRAWGLDEITPAVLMGADGGSLSSLGEALSRIR